MKHILDKIYSQIQWQPIPVLLPGKSHGWRSLVCCSPWGRWELDTSEQLHFHFSLSCTGEENGNPLQCSCLENPRTGETGGLLSMGSHRVGHDRSNLAAAYVYQHPFLPTWGPGQAGGDGGHSMDIVGDRPHRSQGSPALTRPLIRCLAPWSPCLIDRVPDELWNDVRDIVQEIGIKTISMEKKCEKAKWLSGEALQIAVKRKKAKSKEENERYSHFNAEFQRIARKDK